MANDRARVIFFHHQRNTKTDIDIPLNISVNELITGLNQGLGLGMNTENMFSCYLKCENPIAFLKGNKLLKDYGIRNGTVIHFV